MKKDTTALSGNHRNPVIEKAVPNDPFTPYLNTVPAVIKTISVVNSGTITTKQFTFSTRDGIDTVFGILVYPQQAGTYPGILMLHGGGSNAHGMLGVAQAFANRGYVALCVDQPGICGANNTPNSSGPWKSKPAGEGPRFVVTPAPGASTLADAGISNIEAFNLLASQPNVNPAKMGVLGQSWGGYGTTLLSGVLGNRVVAAYSEFGCGFYDKGSFWTDIIKGLSAADRNVWLNTFDAGRRAVGMTAAYFAEEPSDDTFFWPEAIRATLDAIPSATKNLVITPNRNHTTSPSNGIMKNIHFDYWLKGIGAPFGKISITGVARQADGSEQVTINAGMPAGISVDSVKLYYSEPAANWQSRVWLAAQATLVSGTTYKAILPAAYVTKGADFYAYVKDNRNVITSSYMQKAGGDNASRVTVSENVNYK